MNLTSFIQSLIYGDIGRYTKVSYFVIRIYQYSYWIRYNIDILWRVNQQVTKYNNHLCDTYCYS